MRSAEASGTRAPAAPARSLIARAAPRPRSVFSQVRVQTPTRRAGISPRSLADRPARSALGVTAWGMNVIELDPHTEGYPEHDHLQDGQEEVYVVLDGEVTLRTPDASRTLRAGDLCRVPPEVRRKLVTGASGARVLALGGTPGKAFTPTM